MKEVLENHVGMTIGVNIESPHQIDAVNLLSVSDDYFSVHSSTDEHVHHIPYANIVKAVEDENGVEVRHVFTSNERFNLIVKVGHVVVHTVT